MSDYYAQVVDYGPLFARAKDPPTSHAAAKRARGNANAHRAAIVAALAAGPAGQTEIAKRAGLTVAAVSKRLCELRRGGMVERTGREVGNGECEYRRTEAENGAAIG